MVRLFIDIGRSSGISVGDIVGAIANEANVPGKAIGAIDVYDQFTLVDVLADYAHQTLQQMSDTRIRSQKANIRPANSGEISEGKPTNKYERDKSSAGKQSDNRGRNDKREGSDNRARTSERPKREERSKTNLSTKTDSFKKTDEPRKKDVRVKTDTDSGFAAPKKKEARRKKTCRKSKNPREKRQR
jgi:hypothetical protein